MEKVATKEDEELLQSALSDNRKHVKYCRYLFTVLLLSVFIHSLVIIEPLYFTLGYTQWGSIMTLSLALMLSACSTFGDCRESKGLWRIFQRIVHIYFEIIWCSEFIITIFFWCVLFVFALTIKNTRSISMILYNMEVHALPMIFLCVDFKLNKKIGRAHV